MTRECYCPILFQNHNDHPHGRSFLSFLFYSIFFGKVLPQLVGSICYVANIGRATLNWRLCIFDRVNQLIYDDDTWTDEEQKYDPEVA